MSVGLFIATVVCDVIIMIRQYKIIKLVREGLPNLDINFGLLIAVQGIIMAVILYKIGTNLNNLRKLSMIGAETRKNSTIGFTFAQVVIVCMAITQFVFFSSSTGSSIGSFFICFANFSFFVF